MGYSFAVEGTTVIYGAPAKLESIFPVSGTMGSVSVYDASQGTALPGTPVAVIVFTGIDPAPGKNLNLVLTEGIVTVLATDMVATVSHDGGRGHL